MPFNRMREWLKNEKELGVENPNHAVLATATSDGTPHSRVVAIREIEENSLLFFTQLKTRKVSELLNNPSASMNFLLSLQQRQIIIEGIAKPISQEENKMFWETLPRDRQLRFSSYASTSGQSINSLDQLEKRRIDLTEKFNEEPIPMSDFYCGFRLIPEVFIFYTVGTVTFSEVIKYFRKEGVWQQLLLSP